jgi:hypothetical protein
VLVVHDLVADIDRWAVFLQRPLDDLDGAHHAGAETARLGQIYFHGTSITQFASLSVPEHRPGANMCNIRTTLVCDPQHVNAWKHRALCQKSVS